MKDRLTNREVRGATIVAGALTVAAISGVDKVIPVDNIGLYLDEASQLVANLCTVYALANALVKSKNFVQTRVWALGEDDYNDYKEAGLLLLANFGNVVLNSVLNVQA